jgi:hypothetical protein
MGNLRDSALSVLDGNAPTGGEAIPDLGGAIQSIVQQIDRDLAVLHESDIPAALKKIEDERVELRHREVLSQNLKEMLTYVENMRWIARAESVRGSLNPRPITEKEQALFSDVIADDYRRRLAAECGLLSAEVPIRLRTQGRKGQTVLSLTVGDMPPQEVLSEGEQRAVALADFLTEVGLNEANAGIILDDPVTSLDHHRKSVIADRLVAESKARQVVIFTHDMVFLVKLTEAAQESGVPITVHWMQRSPDGTPGFVSHNDAPTTTAEYRTTTLAEESLGRALTAAGSIQEAAVRQGAGRVRRTIEEVVPQYLLKEVVKRWNDRVMITSLRKIVWDTVVVAEIVDLFEECSAIMEGHSHTEAGTEVPPTPEVLDGLIKRTKEVIKSVKKEPPKK